MTKNLLVWILALTLYACGSVYEDFPVPPASLVAQFSYEINQETREVTFVNNSIIPERAGSVTYTWSFGDGNTSGESNPTHTYQNYGEYNVKLVIIASEVSEIKETSSELALLQPINIDFTLFYMDTDFSLIRGVGQTSVDIDAGGFGAGIALDPVENKLYFTDDDNLQIKRVDIDGSNPEVVHEGLTGATNLTLDLENRKVYWTNRADGSVQRGNMDGTGTFETIITGLSLPEGIAYHDGKVYISDVDVPPIGENIYVANANGSGLEVFISGSWGYGMGIDPINERLYFGDQGVYDNPADNRIKSVNLKDKSDILVTTNLEAIGANGSRTYGIAIDPQEGHIYWGDRNGQKIKKANLDGSDVETLLVTEGTPRGLAIFK